VNVCAYSPEDCRSIAVRRTWSGCRCAFDVRADAAFVEECESAPEEVAS
jgi:hypothetical protein